MAFSERGIAGAVALVLVVLVIAVLLRPFQIGTVQLLEGYWRRGGLLKALTVERHIRAASAITARLDVGKQYPEQTDFATVARYARRRDRAIRIESRAEEDQPRYPIHARWIMPTALGNVLRRAETTAGQRYGLDTVNSYPRLYPHLSPRLDAEVNEQLNGIDVMATFVIVFGIQTIATSPLAVRLDWWSLVPVVVLALAALSYRGALSAADRYGVLLATAYDLHRFDMIAAMHLPLHTGGKEAFDLNERVSEMLTADRPQSEEQQRTWRYEHPVAPWIPFPAGPAPGAGEEQTTSESKIQEGAPAPDQGTG